MKIKPKISKSSFKTIATTLRYKSNTNNREKYIKRENDDKARLLFLLPSDSGVTAYMLLLIVPKFAFENPELAFFPLFQCSRVFYIQEFLRASLKKTLRQPEHVKEDLNMLLQEKSNKSKNCFYSYYFLSPNKAVSSVLSPDKSHLILATLLFRS